MKSPKKKNPAVTLKVVAKLVGLTPGTVFAVLNNSAASRSIPNHTKQRILAAAQELDYKPNYFARFLRLRRTYTIGVIAEEIGDPYGSMIISGIEQHLRQNNFFFLTVSHRHDPKLLETYSQMLFIAWRGRLHHRRYFHHQTVVFAHCGRSRPPESAWCHDIVLDHKKVARLALQHLRDLGHQKMAFIRGQTFSSDSAVRWAAIREVAAKLGIRIDPELTIQLESTESTLKIGYPVAKELLSREKPFTALFAYNDISAIGSLRAIRDARLRVPEDISVVGFDDIPGAAFSTPALTTVRQPLLRMGQIAAKTLLDKIEGRTEHIAEIAIEPDFVIRDSTGSSHT